MNLTEKEFIDLHEEAIGIRTLNNLEIGNTLNVWDYMFEKKTGKPSPQNGYLTIKFCGINDGFYQIEFK
jgi:hypothetical protein